MESSDEDELGWWPSFPYLVLYEEKEARGKQRENSAKRNGEKISDWTRAWRDYRNRRFYESIIGFHEGSLDLSGRHEEVGGWVVFACRTSSLILHKAIHPVENRLGWLSL